jgi:two-component system sensor histidine kinase HydH
VGDPALFEALAEFVGFTATASERLRALHPLAAGALPAIVDDFYAALLRHPPARALLSGAEAQVLRLKAGLRRWLDELLLGPHDDRYFEGRARLGQVHLRLGLPQPLLITALGRLRGQLAAVVQAAYPHDPALARETDLALHRLLDLDLAIMLETYREDLETRHRTAERLSTIGELAAGIGHELRNPLGVMESSLFLVRQHLDRVGVADPGVARHLERIGRELGRSNKIIEDLLELARERPPRRQRLEAAAVVRQAMGVVPSPAGIQVEIDVPATVTIDGDPDQLTQVLANLLINAQQALGGHGRVLIEGRRLEAAATLRIRDDGPGVPAAVRPRIFEALFTTKARGSGLGLALCRRIALAHGGALVLESAEPGATFLLTIPDAP